MSQKLNNDSTPPKVKFLSVVWGEIYIKRFCALSLPSFIASGNLPVLSESTQLEVVIMTSSADIGYFESNVSFQKLKSICPVRFVEIDDLITSDVYGVVLTLAYARPIIACGDSMLDTHFIFMNADFILANGSLKFLAEHIHKGRSIVLAPSYRAIAEKLEPLLEEMVDTDNGILDVPPRELVDMAIQHPHRTTLAKTFNQNVFLSSHPNQLFWKVDENTILGRYFLIFMLCLKPERVIESVNGYCDYSFIPDLCPSGDELAIDDSDNFFMLELQRREQETFLLEKGVMTPNKIAKSLQEWSTEDHRRAAGYDFIFHSKDIPPHVEVAKVLATKTIDEILRRLGKAKPHKNHHYWCMGVEAWKELRKKDGRDCIVPELGTCNPGIRTRFTQFKFYWFNQVKNFPNSIMRIISKEHHHFIKDITKNGKDKAPLILYEPSCAKWLTDITGQFIEVCKSVAPEHRGNSSTIRYDWIVYVIVSLDDSFLFKKLAHAISLLSPNGSLWITVVQPQKDRSVFLHFIDTGELFGNQIKSMIVYSRKSMPLYYCHRMMQLALRMMHCRFRRIARILSLPIIFFSGTAAFLCNIFTSSCERPQFVKTNIGLTIKLELYGEIKKEVVS